MPRRLLVFVLAVTVLAGLSLPARGDGGAGAQDLAQGRAALVRQDYPAAVEHLKSAVRTLDPRDGVALGDAWLQLGIAYLKGQGHPEEALPAFLAGASASPEPSTAWLWASVAAEKLGKKDEAATYRTRALAAPPSPEPPPAPVAQKPEKPDAVQHFFGEAEPAAAAPGKGKDEKDRKDGKAATEKKDEKKDEKKVDAVDYFFGGKKQEPPADEKPPV